MGCSSCFCENCIQSHRGQPKRIVFHFDGGALQVGSLSVKSRGSFIIMEYIDVGSRSNQVQKCSYSLLGKSIDEYMFSEDVTDTQSADFIHSLQIEDNILQACRLRGRADKLETGGRFDQSHGPNTF